MLKAYRVCFDDGTVVLEFADCEQDAGDQAAERPEISRALFTPTIASIENLNYKRGPGE